MPSQEIVKLTLDGIYYDHIHNTNCYVYRDSTNNIFITYHLIDNKEKPCPTKKQ